MKLILTILVVYLLPIYICATEPVTLRFNGHHLFLQDSQGICIRQWQAGAGSPSATPKEQNVVNKGPLPEGVYTVKFNQAIFFKRQPGFKAKLKWLVNYIAWGDLAIPLDPAITNQMYGRTSFMIHGGGWLVGSKGCVYVFSKSEEVFKVLSAYSSEVNLVVRYE